MAQRSSSRSSAKSRSGNGSRSSSAKSRSGNGRRLNGSPRGRQLATSQLEGRAPSHDPDVFVDIPKVKETWVTGRIRHPEAPR
jgi:hypothetical protein